MCAKKIASCPRVGGIELREPVSGPRSPNKSWSRRAVLPHSKLLCTRYFCTEPRGVTSLQEHLDMSTETLLSENDARIQKRFSRPIKQDLALMIHSVQLARSSDLGGLDIDPHNSRWTSACQESTKRPHREAFHHSPPFRKVLRNHSRSSSGEFSHARMRRIRANEGAPGVADFADTRTRVEAGACA